MYRSRCSLGSLIFALFLVLSNASQPSEEAAIVQRRQLDPLDEHESRVDIQAQDQEADLRKPSPQEIVCKHHDYEAPLHLITYYIRLGISACVSPTILLATNHTKLTITLKGCIDEHALGRIRRRALPKYLRSVMDSM